MGKTRVTPEDENKAKIRAELRAKPQTKAQYAYLNEQFAQAANQGDVERAYNYLTQLHDKRDEINKESKSHFFSGLIPQQEETAVAKIIIEISKTGTPSEKKYLHEQIVDHKAYIETISSKKTKPRIHSLENHKKHTSRFSRIKDRLNTLLNRNQPNQIAPNVKASADKRSNTPETVNSSYPESDKDEPIKPLKP